MGSRQNHARPHLGGLAHFLYEYIMFLKEFLEEGEISPRQASQPNRASLPPYEQPIRRKYSLNWSLIDLSTWYVSGGCYVDGLCKSLVMTYFMS